MDGFESNRREIDSHILENQYDLWERKYGFQDFEPYASVIYSILFSKYMKIKEVRILKREAYEKSPIIDKIVINSIKETMEAWRKKKKFAKHKKNVIFASRTRVVIPTIIK